MVGLRRCHMLHETGVHTVCDDQIASIVVRRLQSCNLFARACKDAACGSWSSQGRTYVAEAEALQIMMRSQVS